VVNRKAMKGRWMQILTIDVGTGTQDIYLFRSGVSIENGYKMVMPSPTMRIRDQIQAATQRQQRILLTGVTMGGGPCHWAAEAHLRAGNPLFATVEAAQTFNDDLSWVEEEMGITIVSEDEVKRMDDLQHIELYDTNRLPRLLRISVSSFIPEPSVLRFSITARRLRESPIAVSVLSTCASGSQPKIASQLLPFSPNTFPCA